MNPIDNDSLRISETEAIVTPYNGENPYTATILSGCFYKKVTPCEGKRVISDFRDHLVFWGQHSNRLTLTNGIALEFPGEHDCQTSTCSSKGYADYRMRCNDKCPKHPEICKELYDLRIKNMDVENAEQTLIELLDDVYKNGTATITNNMTQPEIDLRVKLFWITLQEDINSDDNRPNAGRRYVFSRYLEAIIVARENCSHTIEEVMKRADKQTPKSSVFDWELDNVPSWYNESAF